MTLNEAKKAFDDLDKTFTLEEARQDVHNLLDKIYEDMQSTTCDMCEHSFYHEAADYFVCTLEKNKAYCYRCNTSSELEVTKHFGCVNNTPKKTQDLK